jgi:hypothetical protein
VLDYIKKICFCGDTICETDQIPQKNTAKYLQYSLESLHESKSICYKISNISGGKHANTRIRRYLRYLRYLMTIESL